MNDNLERSLDFNDFKYSKVFFDIKISRNYYLLTILITSFIVILLLYASIFDFDIVAKGYAVIRPKEEVSLIKTLNSGIVTEKSFMNGQFVREGDVLVIFNTNLLEFEIETQKKLIEQNEKNLNCLESLMKMVEKNEFDENAVGEAKIQASVYFSQKKIKELNYEKAKRNYDIEYSLPESVTYKQRLLDIKNEYELAEADLNSFLSDYKYTLCIQKNNLINEKEKLKQHLCELEEQLIQSTIHAPKDGIIEELEAFNCGDLLMGGENILRIVPIHNDSIKAQVNIGQSDIANLKIGQNVKIKLNALNSNEYGQVKGVVSRISADSLYDSNQNSYYLVDVEIPKNNVENKKKENIKLRPGMTGTARIIIRRKKLIRVILDKLNF